MLTSLYTGLSGLESHRAELDVVSNNIANVNTTGFKGSRVAFQEIYAQTLQGAMAPDEGQGGRNPMQLGLGTQVGRVETLFQQGTLRSTGQPLDLAIVGEGLLILRQAQDGVLNEGEVQRFTRDGALSLDAEGYLLHTGSGLRVQGRQANTGSIIAADVPLADVRVPQDLNLQAQATSETALTGNLEVAGEAIATSLPVYDSLGQIHAATVTFAQQNAQQWNWTASLENASVGSGSLTFDANGRVQEGGTASLTLTLDNGAASPQTVQLDLNGLTQLQGSSDVVQTHNDGFPPGALEDVRFDEAGVLYGLFDNGQRRPLAQLALARFTNPSGLLRARDNLFTTTANSGQPQIVTPGQAGAGELRVAALEASNVDLAAELVRLLITQRGFQASTRVITTADQILQDTLALAR